MSVNKLASILRNADPRVIDQIIELYFSSSDFGINALATLNLNKIVKFSFEEIVSFLFYLGFLTIKPSTSFNILDQGLVLSYPNRMVKNLFRECLVNNFLNLDDQKSLKIDVDELLYNRDQISNFVKSCQDYLGTRLTNQHLLKMKEPYLVGILATALEQNKYLEVWDEYPIQIPKLGQRFVDLYIRSKTNNAHFIFEFKYLPKSKYKPRGKEFLSLKKEAKEQLALYKEATNFKELKLHAYVLIFVDATCVECIKI